MRRTFNPEAVVAGIPSGTVTFLLTDIQGSTARWEADHARMERLLAEHDHVVRQAIEAHGGYVFKTAGDGFLAAFDSSLPAVKCGVALQLELQGRFWDGEPLRVRTAVHAGTAVPRDGDYFGPAVNRSARVLSVVHGAQVVVTQAVRELIIQNPDWQSLRWSLLDLDRHRLPDLQEPEQLYQVVAPGLPHEFPPLRSLDARLNNLPRQLTSFIGRAKEAAEVRRLLKGTRLLTLTGPGGCGKTRLAIQVAADVFREYADGTWFVDLSSLQDEKLLAQAVAQQLAGTARADEPPTDTLVRRLGSQQLLLILDNCEHLARPCARLVQLLLQRCAQLRVLATSREALGVPGETPWLVPSLPFPREKPRTRSAGVGAGTGDQRPLREYEAVQLFLERAATSVPNLAFDDDRLPVIAQICRRLDGIPLALELAASRVRVLSVEQIAERLNERLRLLKGPPGAGLERHRTLRAAIEWSYDLLSLSERLLLRRLSVFAGTWSLEAAEAVCSSEELDAEDVLDLLARLVDRSLVTVERYSEFSGGLAAEVRYRLLETIREYSHEQLHQAGEAELLRTRHQQYYQDFAERAEPELQGPQQVEWLDRLERDYDNLRAALAWPANSEARLRLAAALWRFWYQRGPLIEGRSWIDGALARGAACSAAARAKASSGAGNLALQQGDYEAARAHHSLSLELRRELGDQRGVAASLNNLGIVARRQGDLEAAEVYTRESLELNRVLGCPELVAAALVNLWVIAYARHQEGEAIAALEESRAIYEQLGDQWRLAIVLHNLGETRLRQAQWAEARQLFQASLALLRQVGDTSNSVLCLNGLAMVATEQADYEAAARLFAAEARERAKSGNALPAADRADLEGYVGRVREGLTECRFAELWAEGGSMPIDEAVLFAAGWRVAD